MYKSLQFEAFYIKEVKKTFDNVTPFGCRIAAKIRGTATLGVSIHVALFCSFNLCF